MWDNMMQAAKKQFLSLSCHILQALKWSC